MKRSILITAPDFKRLTELVEQKRAANSSDRQYLETLEQELDYAEIVEPTEMPSDVVTMNSEVRFRDLDSGELKTCRLIFPRLNPPDDGLSVLAPIGTALLGYRTGDVIEWKVPKGIRKVQIMEVLYQPEAAAGQQSK